MMDQDEMVFLPIQQIDASMIQQLYRFSSLHLLFSIKISIEKIILLDIFFTSIGNLIRIFSAVNKSI
jgi:hypothetical protein